MHIVFEGLSFTGKTTQAKQLIECLEEEGKHVVYNKSAPAKEKFTGKLIKAVSAFEGFPPNLKEELYGIDMIVDHLDIRRQLIGNNTTIIQDRSLVSFLSFNAAYHTKRPLVIRGLLNGSQPPYFRPDFLFYLEASKEERIRRMESAKKERQISDLEFEEVYSGQDRRIYQNMIQYLERLENVVPIDTNNKTIDEISQEIYLHVKNGKEI
ncbi:dTMP kinase [Thermoproteota archaeon]